MPSVMVFLMTLMFVLPSDGSAQAVPSPGDRIRIKQVDGTVLTGTLATWSEESIQLSVGSDDRMVRMAEIPVARIEALEISLGQRSNNPKYIGITVATTSIVGATIGGIAWEPCTGSGDLSRHARRVDLNGLRHWSVGWIATGSHHRLYGNRGAVEPRRNPAPAASRLSIRPVIGSGVGFAGSVRVGGL